ncbi:hypothetical protein RNJ44_03763 [Nakaseomyces bracarensis]|uniref:NAD(P)-binding domain-containing protein n=1 Tax=Nakaseomyces bracarensis TaxID=273131 RepID=A0ABR4NY98_9SACH
MSGPLRVAVVGANGKVGRLLINLMKNQKSNFATPLALVRKEEQVKYFQDEVGVDASLTSIESATVPELQNALKGCDAVVFSAGAGGQSMERIFTVDLEGCAKVIEACEKTGISRFIIVSAIKAEDRSFWWDTSLRSYYIAKKAADLYVRQSNLDWTILHPGFLGTDPAKGKLVQVDQIETKKDNNYHIERADVAQFIVDALLNPEKTVKKTIPLANGDVPIKDFIGSL